MQFKAPFHNDRVILCTHSFCYFCSFIHIVSFSFSYYVFLQDTIEVPSFYHKQCVPEYPDFVQFRYDEATYQIRLRQHQQKVFFAEGLKHLRKDLGIFESMTINFFACDDKSTFDLHFTPSLDQQTCGRPWI